MVELTFPRFAKIPLFLVLIIWALLPASRLLAGPLLEKARAFDKALEEEHTPQGMVFNLLPGTDGKSLRPVGGGDSTIWTGAYIAAQCFRFRVTKEPAALANIEKGLWAFHHLHAMTGSPGFLGRCFGPREWFGNAPGMLPGTGTYSTFLFHPDTSRDQYTGIFLAYTLAWPLIRNPELRKVVREDVGSIAKNLSGNGLALEATIGRVRKVMFNLDPTYCYQDRITREEWESVDDFPAETLARIIPFDERLARALSTFRPPPIRGGEAFRALLMLQAAASITEDPDIGSFFRDELCARRDLPRIASRSCELLSDLYLGTGDPILLDILGELAVSVFHVGREILIEYGIAPRSFLEGVSPALEIFVVPLGHVGGKLLLRLLKRARDPAFFLGLARFVPEIESLAGTLEAVGCRMEARRALEFSRWLNTVSRSNIDEFSDAMRSYVGTNLTFFALLGILEGDPAPDLASAATDAMRRAYVPIEDESNSLYTFIRTAYCKPPVPSLRLEQAKEALLLYPSDRHDRLFDHSSDPGLELLPWPDRLSHWGRQSKRIFPLNQRAPDIFIWQDSPRSVVTGSRSGVLVAPVGYALAYWLGRAHGLLTAED